MTTPNETNSSEPSKQNDESGAKGNDSEHDHPETPAFEGDGEGDLKIEGDTPPMNLQKNDRSLAELHRWKTKGRLIVDPEWQRQYVWDRKRASRLIESFLIQLPVPVIYLGINESGRYEVIDGLQRLTSVFDFFENQYKLTGLEVRANLNGLTFNSLDADTQAKLEETTVRTFELAQTVGKDLMFVIFERLNTGGMALNDMEIRNCLYRGKLNDLIKELAKNDDFVKCLNQKGLEKRMADRTLILRFLAFYQMTYGKAKKGLKSFFNEFFTTYRDLPAEKEKEYRQAFKNSIKACLTVFGDKGFRLRRNSAHGGGEWTPRVNASIFQVIATSFTEYNLGALTRKADAIFEGYLDLIATDPRWEDSVTLSTGDFPKIEYAFSKWGERLRDIMNGAVPNDPTRLFSRALKEELFKQSSTCHLCGQKITLINDSALDHDVRYWQGGQTIPSNARLVHRGCNLRRSHNG